MADLTATWSSVLTEMSEAFSVGDNPRGEELLGRALDGGAPWDVVTTAVANALTRYRQLGVAEPSVFGVPA
ncbi:MAG: hypothetical protein U0893_26690 [Chloroflexota bacterium]